MKGIRVRKEGLLQGEVVLEGSKSLSNRILLLEALSGRCDFTLPQLSPSEDTRVMRDLLLSPATVLDAGDCGTAFRFMTAWLAWKGEARILTGSARMLQRPVGPLVEALRTLGFQIKYMGEVGFPPLQFGGIASAKGAGSSDAAGASGPSLGSVLPLGLAAPLEIRADVSSQFVSALCLLGPVLPGGLDLVLKGKLSSTPYIEMTLGLLEAYGILTSFDKEKKRIRVWPGPLVPPANLIVESDWSAAAFYFAMLAHAAVGSELVLKGLRPVSLQGDARIVAWAPYWGVRAFWRGLDLCLRREETALVELEFPVLDFTDCPDLAQPVMVALAARGLTWRLQGLHSLPWKETNRLEAMQRELGKLGIRLLPKTDGVWELSGVSRMEERLVFEVYGDHRMAMAMAVLGIRGAVVIKDPQVVDKSYAGFWSDLEGLGFDLLKF